MHTDLLLVNKCKDLVIEAACLIKKGFTSSYTIHRKKNGSYVTDVDYASETFLLTSLSQLLPKASLLSEEHGFQQGSSEYCWVIDPLDGTSNFIQGLPYFCVSVALTYQDTPIFGVIVNPLTQEVYVGVKGEGAYYNDAHLSRICVENKEYLLVASHTTEQEDTLCLGENTQIKKRVMGSIALDLMYCARGVIDACVFHTVCWWDIAAATAILSEVGIKITDYQGEQLNSTSDGIIVTHTTL